MSEEILKDGNKQGEGVKTLLKLKDNIYEDAPEPEETTDDSDSTPEESESEIDSGANSNFIYQAVIEEMKRSPDTNFTQKNMQNTILYRLLSIEQTDKRHTVETADEPALVNSRAMINVEIHSKKNMIILGKPSLFKLKYELQPPNKECFTIEGHKYYFEFTDAKDAYKLMELPNDSLLQQLKGTYPAVFTPKIPTSNTSKFTYKVILRNYPYNKVKLLKLNQRMVDLASDGFIRQCQVNYGFPELRSN
ncbi:hypothetical protein HII13_004139 [Brettanomyces bruxellensis]|nr:hypothetical protein HII13_004139 [Brettanomyces bruxellensis]